MTRSLALMLVMLGCLFGAPCAQAEPFTVSTFEVDATPPLGSPLCSSAVPPAAKIDDPLTVRGLVLRGAGQPIVLCAVDWVGIGNGGYDTFRQAFAKAAGTAVDRVALHTLHQHDAPSCDFEAEELLAAHGLAGKMFDVAFARQTIASASEALTKSLAQSQPVTHLGIGVARVEQVASNRRVLGPDGKVQYIRYSASNIPEARAAPEGTIDPDVRLLSFWNGDRPVAVLSYYATHPQSYYGKGGVTCDFVGLARNKNEKAVSVPQIHFNGAAGNVTAGKYNDGAEANRLLLTNRLAAGMAAAWKATRKVPLTAADVGWKVAEVRLPLSPLYVDDAESLRLLDSTGAPQAQRVRGAVDLVWARRVQAEKPLELSCLRLGPAYVLHMPGELFIEYQLAAAKLRPDATVCMAAYGDYGPGYIGTEIAYTQGGYETGYVSRVAPRVEKVLLDAIDKLLH